MEEVTGVWCDIPHQVEKEVPNVYQYFKLILLSLILLSYLYFS